MRGFKFTYSIISFSTLPLNYLIIHFKFKVENDYYKKNLKFSWSKFVKNSQNLWIILFFSYISHEQKSVENIFVGNNAWEISIFFHENIFFIHEKTSGKKYPWKTYFLSIKKYVKKNPWIIKFFFFRSRH